MSKNKRFEFSWSRHECNLKEFVEYYRGRLPLIVRVNQGYCGYGEDKYTFSTEEIYRITNINIQKRVIAKDMSNRLLSIPAEYPIRFHIIERRKQLPASYLSALLRLNQFRPGMKVIPEDGAHLTFWVGADKSMKTDMGTLELVDTYDDQYLVGNSINPQGSMWDTATCIPLFIKIKLVLANGIKGSSEEEFKRILAYYDKQARSDTNGAVRGNPEIMSFDARSHADPSEYIYLEPNTYISCAQANALRSSVPKKDQKPATTAQNPIYDEAHEVPLSPKEVKIPPPVAKKRLNPRTEKPLPPLPTETNTGHLPQNSQLTFQNNNQSIRKKEENMQISSQKVLPSAPEAEYLQPADVARTGDAPVQSIHSPSDISWETEDDIQPYTTYCEFTKTNAGSKQHDHYYNFCFRDITEVPTSLKGISKTGISDCLKFLHLEKYVKLFSDNDIDGDLLMSLDRDSLVALGLTTFEAHKIIQFKDGWRPKE